MLRVIAGILWVPARPYPMGSPYASKQDKNPDPTMGQEGGRGVLLCL
jgi:hypothetical protein